MYTYIYIHISILKTFRKEYCIIYIIYIQVQAVVKNYKCCNVTRKFQFGLFWSVLNLILESAAVKDSSFYHVFSPHLIKDQLHQEMSCAICCPASSNRLGCDGAIHLTQKNRGPDVFFMTPKKKNTLKQYIFILWKGSNTRSSKWLQQLTTPTFSAMDSNTSKAHLVVTKPKAHRVFLVPTWAVEVPQRLDCRLRYVSLTLNILQIIW